MSIPETLEEIEAEVAKLHPMIAGKSHSVIRYKMQMHIREIQIMITVFIIFLAGIFHIGFIITISGWSFFIGFSYIFYQDNEYLNSWLIAVTLTMGSLVIYSFFFGNFDITHLFSFVCGLSVLIQKRSINLKLAVVFGVFFIIWSYHPIYFPFNSFLAITFIISEIIFIILLIKRKISKKKLHKKG